MSLFREQALAARQTRWLGDIVLVRPLSFTLLAAFAVALALTVCAFLAWGSYTRHVTVGGQLVPDAGMIKVYVPQSGIVIERQVSEGQHVKAGDPLYILSSDRQSSSQGATQAAVSREAAQKQASLRDEIGKTRQLQQMEYAGLIQKIAGLRSAGTELDRQIDSQHDRVRLAAETVERYRGLMARDYVSKEQFQQKQEDLLDQQNRQQGLERDRIGMSSDLAAQQTALAGLALKHHNQLAEIERNLDSASQELAESEANRRIVITAPASGTATAVVAETGQTVDGNRPLLSIVPAAAVLRAELYAPSNAIGFIQPGDRVLIRYQAYPYQKFGHQTGVVASVAQTALSEAELNASGNPADGRNSEPVYRIIVSLASQQVKAYGVPHPLQAGMRLDADVQQEKLRLYEWVLEPLYNLTGKL